MLELLVWYGPAPCGDLGSAASLVYPIPAQYHTCLLSYPSPGYSALCSGVCCEGHCLNVEERSLSPFRPVVGMTLRGGGSGVWGAGRPARGQLLTAAALECV